MRYDDSLFYLELHYHSGCRVFLLMEAVESISDWQNEYKGPRGSHIRTLTGLEYNVRETPDQIREQMRLYPQILSEKL